jgi:hypothetical protein
MRLSSLRVSISGLVTAGRLRVRTLNALASDWRRSNISSADVGIERLGKSRCRNDDQSGRGCQNTFHSILLFDVTWSPPWRFPTHVRRIAVNRASNDRLFAFISFHLTTDLRVQHPTLNDRFAIHVFAKAIGTTAFLRFCEQLLQNVRQLCGSRIYNQKGVGGHCPLFSRKRTFQGAIEMSANGQ